MSMMRRRMMMKPSVSDNRRRWMEVPFSDTVVLWAGSDSTYRSWLDYTHTAPDPDDVRLYGARQIAEAQAYWTVFCVTTYYVGTRDQAGVKCNNTNVSANNSFTYNGQTWYYSGYHGYAQPKNRTELDPACVDLAEVTGHAHSNKDLEQAARDLLDYYYGVI